jgi:spermidine/putrescine transport system permease protein
MRETGAGQKLILNAYLILFFLYIFAPLAIMGAAAFNTSRFPTVTPWLGTTLDWFVALWNDRTMWSSLGTSLLVGLGVVLVSVPIGTAAALVLDSLGGKSRGFLYGVMVSPILTPGVVIGIATLVFWQRFGVGGGKLLIVFAQASYITAYVMLMVSARLQRFDRTQEEAALDLGADRAQVFRRILLPFLRPALLAGALIGFLQSFENYNTTLFVRGLETPLTIYIATKVRTGITPSVNALGLVLIVLTLAGAVAWEILRRREQRRREARAAEPGPVTANAAMEAAPAH